jgi:phosphoribosylanthranilate isomerase
MKGSREDSIPGEPAAEPFQLRSRTRVKICGVTSRGDAWAAIEAGADALGFNLFRGSRRYLSLEENSSWICALPPFVTRVAVIVNAPLEDALRIAGDPAVDLLQLHGDEDPGYCAELMRRGHHFIKALRLGKGDETPTPEVFGTPHLLLDASVPGEFGGTGRPIDFTMAGEFVRRYPRFQFILAGGLTPDNVRQALLEVRPFAVDVATGVEREPGRKDSAKMRAFCAALS